MILIPAIDIIDRSPVRLFQGDYAKKEVVGESVADLAKQFEQAGAKYVHLVDLDGARLGTKTNAELIVEVAQSLSIPVEVGGGIRSLQDIEYYIEHGVDRVILGTVALENPALCQQALALYGEHIAIGIDCKNGYVCGSGWLTTSEEYYTDFARRMEQQGASTLIFTDISKDGTLQGPNLTMLKELQEACSCRIIASGGIRDESHIRSLLDLDLYGAIAGKSIYAGTLDLKQALQLCKEG